MKSRSFQVCNSSLYKKETGEPASDHLSLHLAVTPPRAGILLDWPLATTAASAARMRSLLLLVVLLVACTEAKKHHRPHCFSPDDVPEGHVPTEFLSRSRRWDRHSAVQLVPYLEKETSEKRRQRRHHSYNCSALQLQNVPHSSIHERSISPWSHQINEDENRYPRRLAFAYCLCKGCIDVKTGRETSSLNSVPVFQEMMVLRRKPCPHPTEAAQQPKSFTLEVEYLKVPVACACVLPQTSS